MRSRNSGVLACSSASESACICGSSALILVTMRWSCLSRRSLRLPKTPVSKRLSMGVPVGKLGLMRGRIRTRSLALSSPNEKRAPGSLFGNATLYVETPAGGIKPVSDATDFDHHPARRLMVDVTAHASAVGRGYAPDGS